MCLDCRALCWDMLPFKLDFFCELPTPLETWNSVAHVAQFVA
jgi:hypothetical protein